MAEDWKDKLNSLYSDDPEFKKLQENKNEENAGVEQQDLRARLDRKKRKGKTVTLIYGFDLPDDDINELARELKLACGTGGTAKDGEIILQGNCLDRSMQILKGKGHKVKKSGG